jgi:hypothetical protein
MEKVLVLALGWMKNLSLHLRHMQTMLEVSRYKEAAYTYFSLLASKSFGKHLSQGFDYPLPLI